MMLYERNNGSSANLSFTFDFGKNLSYFDCHSIALNDNETHLLLVGNHELRLINFETFITSIANTINEDNSITISCSSDIQTVPSFDICNVNRPIVQWNQQDPNQYALAVDRLVRLYRVDYGRIEEIYAINDTQHQRPISTIAHWPRDPNCLLTGSLDGQVQIWDIRQCSAKTPANLKLTLSTPFNIRHIQWSSSSKSDRSDLVNDSNYLAIQCDRCVRIYDMRRADQYLSSIEHAQRVISMDWTMQNRSIVTLSIDNSLRIFSSNGNLLAESVPNEQSSFILSKIQTTSYDSLFVCASRDTMTSTYGLTGWRWDEDHYLRPLTDRIVSTTSAAITDFTFVTNPRFCSLFNPMFSSRSNNEMTKHFPILTWCRDGQLRLIDMDSRFRQTWHDYMRTTNRNLSDSSNVTMISKSSSLSNLSRQQLNRLQSNKLTMDVIEDEITDPGESDLDENHHSEFSSPRINSTASPEMPDENDLSISSDRPCNSPTEISIQNEFTRLQEAYGPYIIVETKDEQRRICILRCIYPLDGSGSFRIYLLLSRHYPVISQLSVRFKLSSIHNDERIKSLQTRIQILFDETSYNCFYYGQICLHTCLLKLRNLFHSFYKQEKISANIRTQKSNQSQREESIQTNSDLDSPNEIPNNHRKHSNRVFDFSLSSSHTNHSHISNDPSIRSHSRTCGARFAGGNYLICFGRILNLQQSPNSAPPILNNINDGLINRPHSAHIRSISLTVTKSRGNSGPDDQSSSYRSSTIRTGNLQIQNVPSNQRTTMFSAPVRSSFGINTIPDHQRISTSSTSLRHHHHHLTQPNSTVSIYDLSILLPVNKKLASDYKLDLNHLLDMCEINQKLTEKMGKYELAYCWRLLAGLLTLQSTLSDDHSWFQTPMAQGLIKYLVAHYIADGDIQSASMFLLTMLKTSFMKSKSINEHYYDPILYSYATMLHRWKHFYKRTQILQQIDYNCQLPAPINSTLSTIICSICLQPVVGQHFLCAICGHGGHLTHMHGWFSSTRNKHRYCPDKDCTCRCVTKQQELLTMNTDQVQKQQQQHTPTLTPRSYVLRPATVNIRQL